MTTHGKNIVAEPIAISYYDNEKHQLLSITLASTKSPLEKLNKRYVLRSTLSKKIKKKKLSSVQF